MVYFHAKNPDLVYVHILEVLGRKNVCIFLYIFCIFLTIWYFCLLAYIIAFWVYCMAMVFSGFALLTSGSSGKPVRQHEDIRLAQRRG
jgi:uncharacterized membrane protein